MVLGYPSRARSATHARSGRKRAASSRAARQPSSLRVCKRACPAPPPPPAPAPATCPRAVLERSSRHEDAAVRASGPRARGSAPRPEGGVTKARCVRECCVSASPSAALSLRKSAWYANVSPDRRQHEMEKWPSASSETSTRIATSPQRAERESVSPLAGRAPISYCVSIWRSASPTLSAKCSGSRRSLFQPSRRIGGWAGPWCGEGGSGCSESAS
mmetsp:Transcript_19292/g.58705  ORF Transcript_19292/g.58705 Transcript_19292/m.58705 type:complete len:216 (-) Transcript_19292:789-1436(-)